MKSFFDGLARRIAVVRRRGVPKGYFSRWLFRFLSAVMVVFFVAVLVSTDGVLSGTYRVCPEGDARGCLVEEYAEGCSSDNPVCVPIVHYFVPPGSVIGDRPEWWVEYGVQLVFIWVAFAFIVNHWLYVRRGVE